MEVTEKYSEACQEKVSLEDEIILLKDSSVHKDEHDKVSQVTGNLFSSTSLN
jgi:hypothetical protein